MNRNIPSGDNKQIVEELEITQPLKVLVLPEM